MKFLVLNKANGIDVNPMRKECNNCDNKVRPHFWCKCNYKLGCPVHDIRVTE